MKNFALKHPIVASLIVFLTIFVGGIIFVIIGGILMAGECKPAYPSGPCDGGAMIVFALWILLVPASLFLGIVGGSITFVILSWKKEKLEELK